MLTATSDLSAQALAIVGEAQGLTVSTVTCECGCGNPAGTYKRTNFVYGQVAGQPRRFLPHHHQRRESHHKWNGGLSIDSYGYRAIRIVNYPRSSQRGYVKEHILLAERSLGHALSREAEVHHVNGDKGDNRPENLVICEDHAYHMLLHRRQRAYRETGNPLSVKCSHCQEWGLTNEGEMRTKRSGRSYHLSCNTRYERDRRRRTA